SEAPYADPSVDDTERTPASTSFSETIVSPQYENEQNEHNDAPVLDTMWSTFLEDSGASVLEWATGKQAQRSMQSETADDVRSQTSGRSANASTEPFEASPTTSPSDHSTGLMQEGKGFAREGQRSLDEPVLATERTSTSAPGDLVRAGVIAPEQVLYFQ